MTAVAGRVDTVGSRREGRIALWALFVAPPCIRWFSIAADMGRDRSWVAVAAALGMFGLVRRPRWAVPIVAAVGAAVVLTAGNYHGPVFAAFVVWSLVLGAVAVGAVPDLGPESLVPERRVTAAPVAAVVLADIGLFVGLGQQFEPSEALNRMIMGLYSLSFLLVLASILWPGASTRLSSAVAPATAAVGRIAAPAWPRFRAWCRRTTDLRRRWWAGTLPSADGLLDDTPLRATATRPVLGTPATGWRRVGSVLWSYRAPVGLWYLTYSFLSLIRVWTPTDACKGVCTLVQWDSGQYLDIAENGYHYSSGVYMLADGAQQPAAWFPGFALVIRAVRPLYDSYQSAGQSVSTLIGLAVPVLFWTWMTQIGMTGRNRLFGLLCLLWFPYNFMIYGAVYSDPLFVALVIGAFVAWETDRPVLAGLVGAAATLTRVNGLGLVVGLVVAAITIGSTSDRIHVSMPKPRQWGVLLSAGGIGGFMIWCWVRYGELMLYFNAHTAIFGSNNFLKADDWLKAGFYQDVFSRFSHKPTLQVANLLVGSTLTILTLLLVPMLRRRLGPGYSAYVLATVAIIWMGFFDFIAAGRYLSAAFPVFAVCGAWLAATRWARWYVPVIGLAGAAFFTYQFSHTIDLGW